MPSAAELRAEFLALRERGEAPVSRACGEQSEPHRSPSPRRYLSGDTDEAKRIAFLKELATVEGWAVRRESEGRDTRALVHDTGAIVHAWRVDTGRIELSADAPHSPSDGYRFNYQVEKALNAAGSSKSISVSLARDCDALVTDCRRRLLDPLARAWPDIAAQCASHDRANREAHALAFQIAKRCEGIANPGDPDTSDCHRLSLERYFVGGSIRVSPSQDGTSSVDFLRLSVSIDTALEIARVVGEAKAKKCVSDK